MFHRLYTYKNCLQQFHFLVVVKLSLPFSFPVHEKIFVCTNDLTCSQNIKAVPFSSSNEELKSSNKRTLLTKSEGKKDPKARKTQLVN